MLAALRQRKTPNATQGSQIRIWQDLSILVAEVQRGSILQLGEPNYALLSKATQTIQTFLESVNPDEKLDNQGMANEQLGTLGIDDWFPPLNPDPWNLEIGFWQNLAEHPFLPTTDSTFQDLQ